MPPKPNKDLEETLQTILDKLAHFQTQIQQTHDHHETHYNTLHHTLESCKKDWDSKQEVITHTLHTILTFIPPPPLISQTVSSVFATTMSIVPPLITPPTLVPTLPRPPKIQLSLFNGSDPLSYPCLCRTKIRKTLACCFLPLSCKIRERSSCWSRPCLLGQRRCLTGDTGQPWCSRPCLTNKEEVHLSDLDLSPWGRERI